MGVRAQAIPIGDEAIAEYHFKEKDGALVISEIRIVALNARSGPWYVFGEPVPEHAPVVGDGITARILRQVPTGPDVIAGFLDNRNRFRAHIGVPRDVIEAPRRPGSRGRADVYYAEIARMYVERVQAGSRSPAADVARELSAGGQAYSRSYVRDLLSEARRRALLKRAPRGKSGGQLTDKAIDLLADS